LRFSANTEICALDIALGVIRSRVLGPIFPCTFDGRSNWSLINFGTWPEIISMIVFPLPI